MVYPSLIIFMIEIQRRPDPDLSQLPDSIPDLLKRIYLNRGITTTEQLEKAAKALHSYRQLHGIVRSIKK